MAPRHREVLQLREEEGWSYDRIARHLDVGVGTVEALLFRARRALRREFHALAGADSRLAGLPVIGYLLRRTLHARGRMLELAAQAAPMMAATAMSVAVVVGSATGWPSNSHSPTRTARPQASVPEIIMPALTATSLAPAPSTLAPRTAATNTKKAPPRDDPVLRAGKPLGVATAEEGREKIAVMPLQAELGIVALGLDPEELLPPLP